MPEQSLLRSAPYFPVGDVDRSASYYTSILGFDCEYLAGKPSQFAIVSRDGVRYYIEMEADGTLISKERTEEEEEEDLEP